MAVTPDTAPKAAPARPSFAEALAVYLKPRVLIVLFLGFSAACRSRSPARRCWCGCARRRRPAHHRPVRARRHALHDQVPVGAGRGRTRRADAVASARPAARLAGALAAPADRRDRSPRPSAIPSPCRRWSWPAARSWSRPRRRHRTSSSTPSGSRVSTRTSRPPAWRPTSRPIASACWSRPRARCSWSAASRSSALPSGAAWSVGYAVMAALILIGIVTTLVATEPEKSRAVEAAHAEHARDNPPRVFDSRLGALLRISHPRHGVRRRSPSWCCSSSPTRSQAR